MFRYESSVPTERATNYLQQLCKHWSHKFEVAYDAHHGVVHLPVAECTFDAATDHLTVVLESDDPSAFPNICDVVAEHLRRFAARETLVIDWCHVV